MGTGHLFHGIHGHTAPCHAMPCGGRFPFPRRSRHDARLPARRLVGFAMLISTCYHTQGPKPTSTKRGGQAPHRGSRTPFPATLMEAKSETLARSLAAASPYFRGTYPKGSSSSGARTEDHTTLRSAHTLDFIS
ncbi:hypothetical protein B0T26DRAFT_708402 [Lasiosphaeria miniovina]|uniref:Uncharacterized protein n=1 Tax=Lasiosphaeria miniovina TaxID=1954250 RepID=A0AA40DZC0_9PEZI|nr:uncharacterized protein B0T26DRAFT_708402 [Lasiosphaeria miniovina]KAK0717078.1 hypothetical protein B0T26DRAFT_708402 [Lasiosphaeria miniovina]